MKKVYTIVLFIIALAILPNAVNAQCKAFAKNTCKPDVMPYIHDGNYHAAILVEGEEAELYKTFYSDQEYRIVVCGTHNLPDIQFKVVDANRNVLYDNTDHDMKKKWDFTLESSQQLKIVVKVPNIEAEKLEPESGCVAIMFGFKEK